jgi:glutaredoxin 3
MTDVEMYSKSWCGSCARAKARLDAIGVTYPDIDVTAVREKELEMIQRSGAHTVPQIFIDGERIGGHDDLFALEAKGNLDRLLQSDKKIAA